ncbi:MAG TPA: hypothetical protein VFM31_03950 [Nitrososphaeraceae archaeon]|nr:hypothetical protein [Nitrososphaeraceae archaeon]
MSSKTTTMMILSTMLIVSSIVFGSLISEKNGEATICFDCPADANKHLDEAKKSLDSGDIEGAKKHIGVAHGILANTTDK